MISTRGRYALRVLIDLAEHPDEGFVPMKEVAGRQGISLKYLERILPVLVKGGLIEGAPGKGGGYKLTRSLHEYIIGELLQLTETDLAPVACLQCGAEPCERADECRTLPMWKKYNQLTMDFFNSVNLEDLIKNRQF